jgi:glucose-6-phosphate dehydrogenase assembly protein OpcA
MNKRSAEEPDDLAERGLRYTREQFDEIRHQTEDYVRENPAQSLFYAFVVGLILNRLPIGRILGGVFRLALFALKPAILIYGATKLYQAVEDEE